MKFLCTKSFWIGTLHIQRGYSKHVKIEILANLWTDLKCLWHNCDDKQSCFCLEKKQSFKNDFIHILLTAVVNHVLLANVCESQMPL